MMILELISNDKEIYRLDLDSYLTYLDYLDKLGFDSNLIESCKPEICDEHDEIVAELLLQSRFKVIPEDKKMWNFLSSKGFDYSIISFVVNKFKSDASYEE